MAVGGEEGGDEKRSSWFIKIETIKYEITMHQDKCFVTGLFLLGHLSFLITFFPESVLSSVKVLQF